MDTCTVKLSLDKLNVEATCTSVVREYLARKGFKETLKKLDEECPRDENSLNSRTRILEYLKINELYETNKILNKPYAAVLELIMSYLVENDIISKSAMGDKQSKSEKSTNHDIKVIDTEEGELADGSEKRIRKNAKTTPSPTPRLLKTNKIASPKEVKKSIINEELPSLITAAAPLSPPLPPVGEHVQFEESIKLDKLTITESKSSDGSVINQNENNTQKQQEEPKLAEAAVVVPAEEDEFDKMLRLKAQKIQDKNTTNQPVEQPIDANAPKPVASNVNVNNSNNPSSQLLVKDYTLTPIDYQTAVALKTLVFGNPNAVLNEEWKLQAFTFCDYPKLKYGFIQKKGGPCGVLASLQAYMLIELLFTEEANCTPAQFFINKRDRSKLLGKAIAKLLWKCGHDKNQAVVCIPTAKAHFAPVGKYRSDGITETLNMLKFDKYENLVDYLVKSVSIFETDDSPGCMLLLYSAILSREIKAIQSDMDVPTSTLMGQHFYCTQEMVNLLIHGKAYSNVFNDTVNFDQLILRGPDKRNDIGLLSLFEHYKSCEVGSFYKTPKYPIWIICSESHFSVLFSLKKEILSDWKAEKKFDLYYYDGLAKQDEQIKLTIDSTKSLFFTENDSDNRPDDLIPPLELVIRTKWKDTRVDWNGYEPIL